VETPAGQRVICHPRGKKSQVVVGDRVLWLPSQDEGTIEKVEERRNLFYRQDEIRTKSFAANLDQVLILIAAEPEFSESQLARALIAAEAERIRPMIALNKSDLVEPFERAWEPPAALPAHALRRAAAVPAPVGPMWTARTCSSTCRARPPWCWARRAPARAR
jgi:putative ribosome biogenesis GTPase RsgA